MTAGRPPYVPTDKDRQLVEILAGYGVKRADIAKVLGVSDGTVWAKFRKELNRGGAMVEAKLVGNLLRLASGSDGVALRAIMFSLQCRFRWSQFTPDMPDRAEPLGKKAEADRTAITAHQTTEWGELLQ